MASRSSTSRRQRKRNRTRKKKTRNLWQFQLLVILACVGTACILWLDYRIQHEFEGKKWSLPARVYASPMEIYPGQELSLTTLEGELLSIGFNQSDLLVKPGQYSKTHDSREFLKRSFSFWNEREMQQAVNVVFRRDHIARLSDVNSGASLSLVRLEPQLIGKIYPEHNEDRVVIGYHEVPQFLIAALVAVEDRHFFSHFGLDFRGILRAAFTNIRKGEIAQGGSTLTQQLVKNFFLSSQRSYWRKINEVIMALLLERRYSKQEILTAYINEIYLGQHGARGIHGFGTAAEFYFARPLKELRVDQMALLAGLVRGASYYNPRRHPQRALQRRNLVLRLMQEQGLLTAEKAGLAQSKALDLAAKPAWGQSKYPAFLELVRRQLLRDYKIQDLQNEGLRIFTTLVPHIQEAAEAAASKKLAVLEKRKHLKTASLQMAAVILRIGTGEIIALIGGRDKHVNGFNRALDAKRPIGSLIKPAIYLAALSKPEKYNILTLIDDVPIEIKQSDGRVWKPRNYDRKSHGQVSLIDALKNSYNLAAVRLGMSVGLANVIKTLRDTGIQSSIKAYPSLLLGALELSPVEVSQMYQTIANGGFQVPLNSIRAVLDSQARPLQRYALQIRQTLDPAPVFLTNFLLSEVVRSGTGKSLHKAMGEDKSLAGKTGTTNDLRDSWFVGFGDDLLAVIWLGRDDNQPAKYTGAGGAMQLWAEMMKVVKVQALTQIAPESISWLKVATKKQSKYCTDLARLPYIKTANAIPLKGCHDNSVNHQTSLLH
ncbi:MAG: penicillin-binding protein 1B [Proteobacteria bacterium]|nr:penicillin-binding protein 1B [Pseudomonadota bacterium]